MVASCSVESGVSAEKLSPAVVEERQEPSRKRRSPK